MPAPGPGGAWIDDFEGNKLSSKWVATRYSGGGQLDAVWTRVIKNSKIQWDGVSNGTETGWWGEYISLPVDAPGDIKIEALIRQKWYGGGGRNSNLGVGFGWSVGNIVRGAILSLSYVSSNYKLGYNAGAGTPLPGFPSKTNVGPLGADIISKVVCNRRNNYMFIYVDDTFLGQFAYAPTITSVDISATWAPNDISCFKSCDYISVWPREVVK